MAVDTVLSKERSQNIAAQLNPDTTQNRVQQTRDSTPTRLRVDCSRLVSRLATRVRLEKKKYLKARKRVGRPGEGGGDSFLFVSSFCKVQQISLWLVPGNRGNELGLERLHLRRLILRTSPKDFSVGRGNLDEKKISRP